MCVIVVDMLSKNQKTRAINKVKKHDTDTGSSQVQIALLSRKIDELTNHLKKNKKDNHSRRGLLKMVADRRKHIGYLKKKSPRIYSKIAKELGLKTK